MEETTEGVSQREGREGKLPQNNMLQNGTKWQNEQRKRKHVGWGNK